MYGIDFYCKGLLRLIEKNQPQSVFELAIGTGYPFAEKLLISGIDVFGCDISEELINYSKKSFPSINVCVAGYQDIDKIKSIFNKNFNIVYCFRSTWYFSNIADAIDCRLYFTKPSGLIIFDIMNKDCEYNKLLLQKKSYFSFYFRKKYHQILDELFHTWSLYA